MNREFHYRELLDAKAWDKVREAYDGLPHRARTVWESDGVSIEHKCSWGDRLLSLQPWESYLGPWRILMNGVPVFYAFDDYGTFLPDVPKSVRDLIVKADILWW